MNETCFIYLVNKSMCWLLYWMRNGSLLFSLNPVSPAPKDFFDFSYFFCFFYLLHSYSYSSSFSYDVCFSFDFLLFFLNKTIAKEEIHKFCPYLSFDFFLFFISKKKKLKKTSNSHSDLFTFFWFVNIFDVDRQKERHKKVLNFWK